MLSTNKDKKTNSPPRLKNKQQTSPQKQDQIISEIQQPPQIHVDIAETVKEKTNIAFETSPPIDLTTGTQTPKSNDEIKTLQIENKESKVKTPAKKR